MSLKLTRCPTCGQTNVLTVSRIAWERGPKGRPVVRTTPVVDGLLVTAAEADAVVAVCGEVRRRREVPSPANGPPPLPARPA